MAAHWDTRCQDMAEELLGDIPGVTAQDITALASDFQDAFEAAADRIEERA